MHVYISQSYENMMVVRYTGTLSSSQCYDVCETDALLKLIGAFAVSWLEVGQESAEQKINLESRNVQFQTHNVRCLCILYV